MLGKYIHVANFLLKKNVIHDNGTKPEAKESTENNRQILISIARDSEDIAGHIDAFGAGKGSASGCEDAVALSLSVSRLSASIVSNSTDLCCWFCLNSSGSQVALSKRLKNSLIRPRKA